MISETYKVKFNYLRKDGITVIGKEEIIIVDIYKREKDNHELATKQLLKLYPNAEIVSVTYI